MFFEILIFSKPPYASVSKAQIKEQSEPQFDALKRGVNIKTIYEIPDDDEGRKELLEQNRYVLNEEENKMGVSDEIRVIAELPIKLAVLDKNNELITHCYQPTRGKPIEMVQQGL